MSKLPNYQDAIVEINKLRDYCLNPEHPSGKNKAKVFESALGLIKADSEFLKRQILTGISQEEVVENQSDKYGKRYTVRIRIRNFDKQAEVITGWIIKTDENFPRLITCYVNI